MLCAKEAASGIGGLPVNRLKQRSLQPLAARLSFFTIRYKREPATGLSREPMFIKGTLSDPKSPFRHGAGTIHLHPNGRFVYLANRASSTVDFEGKKVFTGGENTIAVFSIDQGTGERALIQTIEGRGLQLRTFAIDL